MTYQNSKREPAGFTVIELMVVVSIMALLVAIGLSAFNSAVAQSKISRTKVIIAKLDQLIMEKYESYRTRPVPLPTQVGQTPRMAASNRLNALRELMRMELPDNIADLCRDDELMDLRVEASPVLDIMTSAPQFEVKRNYLNSTPSLAKAYKRKAAALMNPPPPIPGDPPIRVQWTAAHQGAECLYLIISCMRDGDKSGLDFFDASEIGNTDDDAIPEILDAWGKPIEFLRWAPGYVQEDGALTLQTRDSRVAPDPFDPLKVDNLWQSNGPGTFALWPLIYSAGPDRGYDINASAPDYTSMNPLSNPYGGSPPLPGTPIDTDSSKTLDSGDNITNHYQEAE
jgi:prepilin-type N-terminal cleavage/methylation domain-containing protein